MARREWPPRPRFGRINLGVRWRRATALVGWAGSARRTVPERRLAVAALLDLEGAIMRFEGTVVRDGRFWLAEIPLLNALTQGRTRTGYVGARENGDSCADHNVEPQCLRRWPAVLLVALSKDDDVVDDGAGLFRVPPVNQRLADQFWC
jgi:hypothetical protein